MKKIKEKIFLYCLIAILPLYVSAQVSSVTNSILYDGVYIEVSPNQYAKLTPAPPSFPVKYKIYGVNFSRWPTVNVTDAENLNEVANCKKIIIKGFNAAQAVASIVGPSENWRMSNFMLLSNSREASDYYTFAGAEEYNYRQFKQYNRYVNKISESHFEIFVSDIIPSDKRCLVYINNTFYFFKTKVQTTPNIPNLINIPSPTILGGYVKNKTKMHSFINKVPYISGRYAQYHPPSGSYIGIDSTSISTMSDAKEYYVEEDAMKSHLEKNQSFSSNDFSGLSIKGTYDFNTANIYKLFEIELGGKPKKTVTGDYLIDSGKIYLMHKKYKIDYNKQTVGDLCNFIPLKKLEIGHYVICIGNDCWLFTIK
jgi:hypothetical protein